MFSLVFLPIAIKFTKGMDYKQIYLLGGKNVIAKGLGLVVGGGA
jgi:hypothetical protein